MKIFLDAGHNFSGADTGATGHGLREQDITYHIAQKVGELLIKTGVDVKYSRDFITSNVGTSLSASINGRVKMANDWKADYFVSIHCNAFSDTSANGTETLIFSKGGNAERLACNVTKQLCDLGLRNRGVKVRTDLGVLKNTNMPAFLVEAAFISNASDVEFLTKRQDDLAYAIAKGIVGEKLNNISGGEENMAKIVFIGGGKNMKLEVNGKAADGSMLVECKGNTVALSAADLLRAVGHDVSWREA